MKAGGTIKGFHPIFFFGGERGRGGGFTGDISWTPGVEQLITHKMFLVLDEKSRT